MKLKNKKFIYLVLAFICSVQFSFAGDTARTGTAAGAQLTVPVGARYLAMGGANISNVEGVDGIFWNPSGLASMQNTANAVFSTMNIFNDVSVNYLAVGFQMGEMGNLAVTLKSFDFGDIPMTTILDTEGAGGQTFSPTFATVGLTYAVALTDIVKVGVTAKLVSEGIDRASASAFAIDAGIQYNDLGGFNGLSFGIVVRNIGTAMKYDGSGLTVESAEVNTGLFQGFTKREAASDDLPASFEIGLGYMANINERNSLLLTTNFNNYNYGSDKVRLGAEYMFDDMIAVRGGYLLETDLSSEEQLYRFTAGAGFKYDLGGLDLTLDYSFRDSQYYDGNNLFSLTVGF
jgi:hypothetical protein